MTTPTKLGSNGVIDTNNGEEECNGPLRLFTKYHHDPEAPTKEIVVKESIENVNKDGYSVYRIRNDGTCCFQVFKNPYFTGQSFKVSRQYDSRPSLPRVSSVYRIKCS